MSNRTVITPFGLPHGMIGYGTQATKARVVSIAEVDALHKSDFAVVSDKTNAEIFIEAVRLGKKVLRQGIFEMALNARGNIPLPSGNREFLLDCLEFALNGERELSMNKFRK